MGTLFAYTLVAGIFIAVAYIIYRLFFAGRKLFTVSRVAILAVFIGSIAGYAFFDASKPDESVPDNGVTVGPLIRIVDGPDALTDDATVEEPLEEESALMTTVVRIYVAGMAVMVLFTMIGLGRLGFIMRRGHRIKGTRIVLIDDNGVSPFSFMGMIVMSTSAYDDASGRDMIIAHESGHLRSLHPVDLLVSRVVCILFWYNPASWALHRELCRVHEYQVDDSVVRRADSRTDYQMLLLRTVVRRQFYPMTNSLNHLSLTKRISMMNKKTSPRFGVARLASLMIAPIAAVALMSNATFASVVESAASTDLTTDDNAATESAPAVEQKKEQTKETIKVVAVGTKKKTDSSVTSMANDRHASFVGGDAELYKYLAMNVNYPAEAQKNNQQGKVVVGFTVTPEGEVTNVNVARGICPALDQAAVDVIASMPRWEPAIHEGKPAAETMVVPVYFKLQGPQNESVAVNDLGVRVLDDVVVVAYNSVAPANQNVTYKGKPDFTVNGEPYSGNIEDINPEDIESITVRRDMPEHPNGLIEIVLKKK